MRQVEQGDAENEIFRGRDGVHDGGGTDEHFAHGGAEDGQAFEFLLVEFGALRFRQLLAEGVQAGAFGEVDARGEDAAVAVEIDAMGVAEEQELFAG